MQGHPLRGIGHPTLLTGTHQSSRSVSKKVKSTHVSLCPNLQRMLEPARAGNGHINIPGVISVLGQLSGSSLTTATNSIIALTRASNLVARVIWGHIILNFFKNWWKLFSNSTPLVVLGSWIMFDASAEMAASDSVEKSLESLVSCRVRQRCGLIDTAAEVADFLDSRLCPFLRILRPRSHCAQWRGLSRHLDSPEIPR
jgi:hypothetical protein